jgi:hypothetical protein
LVFEGEYNILNTGFADLTPFFTLAPFDYSEFCSDDAQFFDEKNRER